MSDVPSTLGIVGAFVVIAGAFLMITAGKGHEDTVESALKAAKVSFESALNAAGLSESPALNAAGPPFSTKGEVQWQAAALQV